MATLAPASAARAAAVNPAGPAPITTTSNVASLIGLHLHARFTRNLAALGVSAAVDGHSTLKTDTHAAERRARLSGDGSAKFTDADDGNCRGHHSARGYFN